jgi:acetyl esterase/lipase
MKTVLSGIAVLAVLISSAYSQHRIIPIWQPGTELTNNHQGNEKNITEVRQPYLTVFLPTRSDTNRPAVLVFPGGGYRQIVIDKEGYKIARWLNENGIAAFVLVYRLNRDSALVDAQQALSLVRSRAREFHIDPERIGVMGFSAGAHLSLNLAIHSEKRMRVDPLESESCKPNFLVLVYGSYQTLINQVDKNTPPAFLVQACDDDRAPVLQCIELFSALRTNSVPVEMHLYETGGHGFALLENRGPVMSWAQLCIDWMKIRGIISAR